jgi:DNA-binding CsgD family transcriptional regulator
MLVGRDADIAAVNAFLDRASHGFGVLLVEGEAGIGKTSLIAAARASACDRGMRVLACQPTEAEARYAYAALVDLIGTTSVGRAPLSPPQRNALDVALRRATVAAPVDAMLVGLAARELLASCSEERPLLLVVDDLSWLDPPTDGVLAFALRRLGDRRIAVLVTRRADRPGTIPWDLDRHLGGEVCERLWLTGLPVAALGDLLRVRLGTSFSRSTLRRLHALCQGNPFYALHIGRALRDRKAGSAAEGLWPSPEPSPTSLPEPLHELTSQRLAAVEPGDQTVLLALAGMVNPTVSRLEAVFAFRRPGTADVAGAIDRAETAGLVTVGGDGRIGFTHPLYASAVYRGASGPTRRAVHRWLAAVEPELEARARHLALGTVGRDAGLADILEEAATDARLRGASETAAELLGLSRSRTPDDRVDLVARRTVALAEALLEAGDVGAAAQLLDTELSNLPPGPVRARARMARGTAAWIADSALQARDFLLDALDDATRDPVLLGQLHGRLAVFCTTDIDQCVHHAQRAVEVLDAAGDKKLLAPALCNLFYSTVTVGRPPPLDLLSRGLELEEYSLDQSTTPGMWYLALDEWELARDRFRRQLELSREAGDFATEAELLTRLGEVELLSDNWAAARSYADRSAEVVRELDLSFDISTRLRLMLAAHEGRLDEARAQALAEVDRYAAGGEPQLVSAFLCVLAFVAASDGDAATVVELTGRSAAMLRSVGMREPVGRLIDPGPERAEALAVCGMPQAGEAIDDLAERMVRIPRPWLFAALCRARAELAASGGDIDGALAATDPVLAPEAARWRRFDRARTLLTRGRLLRRARRTGAAADCFAQAQAVFDGLGARVWAQRTAHEMDRLGRRRRGGEALTDTEREIVRLASSGATNRTMAVTLHMSPKTVEAHLTRIYRKLGIRSRGELGSLVGAGRLDGD